MVYKCRLSFHTSHTTPAATAIPPRVQSRRCRGFNPRRSWVSVFVSVCVLSPLVVCNSVLAASRLLDSPDSSLCSSIVCPVVCVCRPASVLRRVWVVSRLSGGVPVTGSVGLSVSYSRTVVVTSSLLVSSVVVSVSVCSCRSPTASKLSVLLVSVSSP